MNPDHTARFNLDVKISIPEGVESFDLFRRYGRQLMSQAFQVSSRTQKDQRRYNIWNPEAITLVIICHTSGCRKDGLRVIDSLGLLFRNRANLEVIEDLETIDHP